MGSKPNYGAIQQAYSSLLRQITPHLKEDNVGHAVESVNSLVGVIRPPDWTRVFDSALPSEILGFTRDRKKVVIADTSGTLTFYDARSYEEVHEALTREIVRRESELERQRTNPLFQSGSFPDSHTKNLDLESILGQALSANRRLLGELEALNQ